MEPRLLEPVQLRAKYLKAQKELDTLVEKLTASGASRWSDEVRENPRFLELRKEISRIEIELRQQQSLLEGKSGNTNPSLWTAKSKYEDEGTPLALQTYYDAYWRELRKKAALDGYARLLTSEHEDSVWEMIYIASILVPKPDPIGRFLLGDAYCRAGEVEGNGSHLFAFSGMREPLVLCEVHPDNEKSPKGDYLRAHSIQPGGARIEGLTLGVAGYFGAALAGNWLADKDGLFSGDSGRGRTSTGKRFWENLVKAGVAYESDIGGEEEEEEYEEEQHVCVDLTEGQIERLAERYESGRGDYGWPNSRKLCGDLEFSYTGRAESSEGTDRHYMDVETVLKSPFVVFHAYDQDRQSAADINPLRLYPGLRNNWDPATNLPAVYESAGQNGLVDRFFYDSGDLLPSIKQEITRTMLTNAVHGSSPFLAITIAETLARSGAEDLAATYLSRVDVAPLIANNQRALELLGQRRLPGLSGLTPSMQRSVFSAIAEARAGIKIDWSAENPLRLQPLTAAQKKFLRAYEGLD